MKATSFHNATDLLVDNPAGMVATTVRERTLNYQFRPHFHPYVAELVDRLLESSIAGLQAADTEYVPGETLPNGTRWPVLYEELMTEEQYAPTHLVSEPRPVKTLQFGTEGAYAVYNWELFYHVPMTVAIHLSRNGRYEEAQRWFHYVFDPTDNSAGPAPRAILEGEAVPDDRRAADRGHPGQPVDGRRPGAAASTPSTASGRGRTPRSGRTWSPATGTPRTCSRR